jgi:hypothetical protein
VDYPAPCLVIPVRCGAVYTYRRTEQLLDTKLDPPLPPPSPYLSLSFSLFPPCLYLRLPIFILHCLPYIMIRPLIYKTAPSFPCRDRLQNCPLASPCHTRGPPVMLSNTQHPGWFTNTVLLPLLVCLFLSTHTPLLSRPTNHRHTL